MPKVPKYGADYAEMVRHCFVFGGKSIKAIGLETGIPVRTLFRMKQDAQNAGDDWDKVRAAEKLRNGNVETFAASVSADLMSEYNALMQLLRGDSGLDTKEKVQLMASMADSYAKFNKSFQNIFPGISRLSVGMDAMRLLQHFIAEHYPQHIAIFAEILEPFGKHLHKELVKK